MLTRLRVNGFKNLVDVDIHFGAFTCIAGANGSGKSNLFDALHFLSQLADKPLMDAALSVREEGGRASSGVQNLFHHYGSTYAPRMTFEADMIVPRDVTDDLGKKAKAASAYLRYSLELSMSQSGGYRALEIEREELRPLSPDAGADDAPLHFSHSTAWRESVLAGKRKALLISTGQGNNGTTITLHQEGVRQNRTQGWPAAGLPKTILSSRNDAENPTILAVRRELQAWQVLQLETTALRQPDDLNAPKHLAANGQHLAAALYYLAQAQVKLGNGTSGQDPDRIYTTVANRLSELIDDVYGVRIDRDQQRNLLTLYATGKDGADYPARSLSDGTLRFLALAIIEADPDMQGLLCLEEPENGIHPSRIPAMLKLLQNIACDTQEPVNRFNPLRQVIINTHSPAVVADVPEDSLLLARLTERVASGHRFKSPQFCGLSDTWRVTNANAAVATKGELLGYLMSAYPFGQNEADATPDNTARRVVDRPDIQSLFNPS